METENLRIRFGQWVKEEREKQGLTRKQCAKRVEDWLQSLPEEQLHQIGKEEGGKQLSEDKSERTYSHWAWGQVERRRQAGYTVQRKTCLQVAAGLKMRPEIVYAQAGFDTLDGKLLETPVFLNYEIMPVETQKKFLSLSREKQRLVCELITVM